MRHSVYTRILAQPTKPEIVSQLKVGSSIMYFQIIIVNVIQLLSTQSCLGKVYVLLSVYCKIRHHFLMGD